MLTVQELRSSTVKELLQELEAARKNMLKIRVNVKTKHEKNTVKSMQAKRYVAKILTVMKETGEEKSKVSSLPTGQAGLKSQEEKEEKK